LVKFEVLWAEIEKKGGEALNEAVRSRREKCDCPACPTYNSCAGDKEERVFCLAGKTDCIREEDMQGCICPSCRVQEELGLEKMYYCVYGNAKEQMG